MAERAVEVKKASLRKAYGETLAELGEQDERIVVLTGDLAGSTYTKLFAERFPERFIDAGVAEANMFGVAAGLAMAGKRPFASTFVIFTEKAFEQIRQVIAYPKVPVRIVATHGGITVGPDGASHQTVSDIAVFRALPNMTVIVPADAEETRAVTRFVASYDEGPVFVRLARASFPVVFEGGVEFELGRARLIRSGKDVSLFACGLMLYQALAAAELLAEEGIEAEVINVSTIKPLDVETIVSSAAKTGAAVTAEEHSILGGLGGAIAEVLAEHHPVPLRRVGIRDQFGQSGQAEELVEHYGLTPERIAAAAKEAIAAKEAGRR